MVRSRAASRAFAAVGVTFATFATFAAVAVTFATFASCGVKAPPTPVLEGFEPRYQGELDARSARATPDPVIPAPRPLPSSPPESTSEKRPSAAPSRAPIPTPTPKGNR